MDINTLINKQKLEFDKFYYNLLNLELDNTYLSKAMKYASMNGGKRIRPFLVSLASSLVNLSLKNSMIISSSIESIHSYSLIHDDLPCMDNDDFRRGKKSTHRRFNEATAILAGDALHDLAFQLISGNLTKINPQKNLELLNYLTKCTGYDGLAGGQSLDLLYENKKLSKFKILDMYKKKTGKLFEFSFAAPFIITNASKKTIDFSKKFGLTFGLVFQIIDDLIDEIECFENIGKTPRKDKKQGKRTLLSIVGKNKSKEFCEKIISDFIKSNKKEFAKNSILQKVLKFNLQRLK